MRNIHQRLDFKAGLFAFFLVGIIVMTEALFSWQNNQDQILREYARKSNSLTSTAANSMSFPLWDFDVNIVESMVDALELNPSVISGSVVEKNGNVLIDHGVNPTIPESDIYTKKEEIYGPDGSEIGHLTIKFSLEEIYRASRQQLIFSMLSALGTAMLVFGVIAWIIRWIVKPVQALEAAVRRYDGSQKLVDVPGIERKDEIGALASGVADMAGQIQESMATLESRVEERTEELREAVEKASAANEAKSAFLANMSHEIRTPMNGVLGMTQILQKTNLDEKQKTYVDTIYESGFALVTIINDILDYSKIEAGKVELEAVEFELGSAVEDVAALLGVTARDKNLDLLVRVQPDLMGSFMGDVGRIRQIITNLVGNAIKFTSEGSVLIDVSGTIEAKKADLKILVRDTGIGLKPEKLDVIFDEFNQAENSTTRKYGGTGLGLSITKSLVEAMGGTIRVESEFGKGADFIVELNLPQAQSQEDVQTFIMGAGQTVLVVDDNRVNRDILKEVLESWNLKPLFADSAKQALRVLHKAQSSEAPVNLILTDYNMPEFSGVDFSRAVRKMKGVSKTPIIAISSTQGDEVIKQFARHDVTEFLTKPVRLPLLNEAIHKLLESQNIEALKRVANLHNTRSVSADLQGEPQKLEAEPSKEEPAETIDNVDDRLDFHSTISPVSQDVTESANTRPRFLIVDDNDTNRIVLGYMIDETRFDIDYAEDGLQAYEKAKSQNYDIIFMDISMPVMDGVESMKSIRAFEAEHSRKAVPIIAVTAHAMTGDKGDMLQAGMNDYMSKPVDQDQVTKMVDKWLSYENISPSPIKMAS